MLRAALFRPEACTLSYLAQSDFDGGIEPAVEHALTIEGHVLGITHRGDARVFHDLGVYCIPLLAGFVNDVGKKDRFAPLQLDDFGERPAERALQVVADTFLVIERAVFFPDLAGLLRHFQISGEFLFGNGNNESVNVVGHN